MWRQRPATIARRSQPFAAQRAARSPPPARLAARWHKRPAADAVLSARPWRGGLILAVRTGYAPRSPTRGAKAILPPAGQCTARAHLGQRPAFGVAAPSCMAAAAAWPLRHRPQHLPRLPPAHHGRSNDPAPTYSTYRRCSGVQSQNESLIRNHTEAADGAYLFVVFQFSHQGITVQRYCFAIEIKFSGTTVLICD